MFHSNPFGARTTADQSIAGVDLSGRRFVVTGCNSGLGRETMSALAANGAEVVGMAKSLDDAAAACAMAGPSCLPMECDLSDLDSIRSAADTLNALPSSLDALVANAAVAFLPEPRTRYGLDMHFLVNHLGHFALVNRLLPALRDGGRIVVVSGAIGAPVAAHGLAFDHLGHETYDPEMSYGRSKLATALFAKELARRTRHRGIAVNAVDPGATKGTNLHRHTRRGGLTQALGALFWKSPQRGAATQTLLAASPRVAGITGESWADCKVITANDVLDDAGLAEQLWTVSEALLATHQPCDAYESKPLQAAA